MIAVSGNWVAAGAGVAILSSGIPGTRRALPVWTTCLGLCFWSTANGDGRNPSTLLVGLRSAVQFIGTRISALSWCCRQCTAQPHGSSAPNKCEGSAAAYSACGPALRSVLCGALPSMGSVSNRVCLLGRSAGRRLALAWPVSPLLPASSGCSGVAGLAPAANRPGEGPASPAALSGPGPMVNVPGLKGSVSPPVSHCVAVPPANAALLSAVYRMEIHHVSTRAGYTCLGVLQHLTAPASQTPPAAETATMRDSDAASPTRCSTCGPGVAWAWDL